MCQYIQKFAVAAAILAGGAAGADVTIADFSFTPASVTINAGETVTWTNTGALGHTATSNTGAWDSGLLATGQSFSFTFNTPGTYPYHCTPHPFMTASVTVNEVPRPPTITSQLSAIGRVGRPFSYTITAAGTAPISFSANPLPPGLSLAGAVITGTPTTGGTTEVTLGAINALGSDVKVLTLTIAEPLTGTWTGTTRTKRFGQATPGTRPQALKETVTAQVNQSGAAVSATVSLTGAAGERLFTTTGQAGNNNLWLTGLASGGSDTLALSGHVSAKGNTMKGLAIVFGPAGADEITISLKQAP
jgi:amicyanin